MPTREELWQFYQLCYHYDRGRYERSVEYQPEWFDLLARHVGSPGRLLEVGCSFGYFLRAARDRGWQVEGIELSESAAEFGRRELGLPVRTGILRELTSGREGFFDAVVAWHVVEHEMDPGEFLAAAFAVLRPGGVLALRVPNLASAVARLAGAGWQWLSPPEHIYMFSARTLSFWLKRTGFEISQTTTARGNARNMWFEVLRARTKLLILQAKKKEAKLEKLGEFSRPPTYEDKFWYRTLERAAEVATSPVDQFVSPWLAKREREAELVAVARRPPFQQAVCNG